jgi:hypothetical protein
MNGRVGAGQLIALAAAAALLFFMAMDWYSTKQGDEARRIEESAQGGGQRGGEVRRSVEEQARTFAEGQENNAWQADGALDRLILIALLAAVALTFAMVLLGAAERDSTLAGGLAVAATMVGALLLSYRLLNEPGLDNITTVKAGAPLALVALGVMALGVALGMRTGEPAESEPEQERAPVA